MHLEGMKRPSERSVRRTPRDASRGHSSFEGASPSQTFKRSFSMRRWQVRKLDLQDRKAQIKVRNKVAMQVERIDGNTSVFL
jgi:hypothetical protein